MLFEFRSKYFNAYIVLSLLIILISISLINLPFGFDDLLSKLPGYYHNEDTGKNISELIRSRGFQDEIHFVKSQDDYILTLYRIVNPHLSKNQRKKLKPILLQHGYQNAASTWLINSQGKLNSDGKYIELDEEGNLLDRPTGNTLGFVLASSGYDVWLPNYRGNIYSINHTKFDPNKDKEFWSFSIDEMISYDLPAIIKYIQDETSRKTISYIGHSQGTIIMFGLLSSKPEYSNIIKPFIALSPNPYLGHIKSQVKTLVTFLEKNFNYFSRLSDSNLHNNKVRNFLSKICENYYLRLFCYKIQSYVIGFDMNQYNFDRIGVYFSNLPVGSSGLNSAHIIQMFYSKKPHKYDYGKDENIKRYGQESPPDYIMENINSTNIALIYSHNDVLNDLEDIKLLKKHLKVPLIDDYLIPDHNWGHMELLWAKEAGKYVNSRILKILQKF